MIHPIPPGTRDVLPDEMRELRRLHPALIEVFEARGYGEVATPAIEYDEVLARGDGRAAASAYRFFDERGDLLALRSDMTVPIARLVASRFAGAEPPFRLRYLGQRLPRGAPAARPVREFAQAGVELIGAPAPEGTAEVIEVLEAALDAAGLDRAVIGLGDADLFRQLLDELGVEGERARLDPRPPGGHDLVGLEAELADLDGIGDEQVATCVALSQLRGGARGARARRARSAATRSSGRRRRLQRDLSRRWRRAASPTASSSTSGCCATSATTAARSSRSTTRRSATSSAAAAATTACSSASASTCRRRASPSTWSGCTSPRRRRSAAEGERDELRGRRPAAARRPTGR